MPSYLKTFPSCFSSTAKQRPFPTISTSLLSDVIILYHAPANDSISPLCLRRCLGWFPLQFLVFFVLPCLCKTYSAKEHITSNYHKDMLNFASSLYYIRYYVEVYKFFFIFNTPHLTYNNR